ncbi:MAG: hypothetical protein HYV09_04345 [Deltaproteobacteria bacterium]|nr:hypothetical protein [Deltaproteobacteria bacterium]
MKGLLIVVGAAVALVVIVLLMRAPSGSRPAAPVATALTVVTAATVASATPSAPTAPVETAIAVVAAPSVAAVAAPSIAAGTAVSAAAGDAQYEPFKHREQIEAAVARGDLSALPELQKIDLTQNGYVAAAAIDGVGKLAALAPEKEKRAAVATLDRWLKQESKRNAPDARGNVSILVDALESTKSDAAIAPLVAALDAATHPIFVETRIVEALTALNATSAVASVERFAARTRAMQPTDEFEKSLVAEALAAADAALKAWRR